jgi:hypothetical protein
VIFRAILKCGCQSSTKYESDCINLRKTGRNIFGSSEQYLGSNNNMEWKKNNKTLQILTAAEKGQYGVVAPIA